MQESSDGNVDRVLLEDKYYYQELDRGFIVIVFYHGPRAMGSIDIKTEEEYLHWRKLIASSSMLKFPM